MKRILLDQIPEPNAICRPSEEERRHLQHVRRTREGETLEVLDGKGGLALAEVVRLDKRQMDLKIIQHLDQTRESPLTLEVVLAIPSQLSTLDEMLPGLVQLGVHRVTLVPTEWGGRLKKDPEKYAHRLATIAAQSLKQCGRIMLPELDFAEDYPTRVNQIAARVELAVLYHPVQQPCALPDKVRSAALLIGPEGGFTEEEVSQASAAGWLVRGLGPRILKMETAAIGACYWAQSRYGDL